MRPFQKRMWMQSIALYYGLFGWVIGMYWLSVGESAWWLTATAAGHLILVASLSVGYHRYFTHRAFKTSKAWEYMLGIFGAMSWLGSPVQWAALHSTHHKYSDTARDPHFTGWSYILWQRYRDVPILLWRTRRLMNSAFHRVLHEYYVLIVLWIMGTLLWVDHRLLVFGYLMPLAMVALAGAVHQVVSHRGQPTGAKNMPYMEFLLPLCGEWLHAKHHVASSDADYRTKWWQPDLGAAVVKMIARPA